MKRRLTLRASCKEPSYGISLLTVSLPGREAAFRCCGLGGGRTAEIQPPHLKRVPSDSGKCPRRPGPCRLKTKKGQAPRRGHWRPRSHCSINTENTTVALGDRAFLLSQKETFLLRRFLCCFVLLSSRLFSYIIGADGRLAMPLVFPFASGVFSFGGRVSELLKRNYISNCNIDFLLEEKFVFSFEKCL